MGDAPRGHHRQVEMEAAGRTEASIQLMDPTSEHKYGGVDDNAIRDNDDNEYSMRVCLNAYLGSPCCTRTWRLFFFFKLESGCRRAQSSMVTSPEKLRCFGQPASQHTQRCELKRNEACANRCRFDKHINSAADGVPSATPSRSRLAFEALAGAFLFLLECK